MKGVAVAWVLLGGVLGGCETAVGSEDGSVVDGGLVSVDGAAADFGPGQGSVLPDGGFEVDGAPPDVRVVDGAVDSASIDGAASDGPSPDAPGCVAGGEEVCNGVDDDCDGVVDEGEGGEPIRRSCHHGPPETAGVGLCTTGWRTCAEGRLGACFGAVPPAVEICDGADGDCDGAIDEGLDCVCDPGVEGPCYAGAEGTAGVGPCRIGRQVCGADGRGLGACEGQVLPRPETCDGTDEDCDGIADDDVEGVGSPCEVGVGACLVGGVMICDRAGGAVRCGALPGAPTDERCNGADDDCDGRTDEGFELGAPCVVGRGVCEAAGVVGCGPDGDAVCSARAGVAGEERCNGLDDDCDGGADDGLGRGGGCVAGVGACAGEGELGCDGAGEVVCDAVAADVAAEEICNDIDDDCDGITDEGVAPRCYEGPAGSEGVGVCRAGYEPCDGELAGACVDQVVPGDEICNGLDDDCDGGTDEGLVRGCYGGAPETEGVGPCRAGSQACVDGVWGACDGAVLPAAEGCDGADDDCDGATDEGLANRCYGGPAGTDGIGVCVAGTTTCAGGRFGACEAEVTPEAEVCDGADDDCDGGTDEGTDRPCYGGPAGTAGVGNCRAGVEACVEGAYAGECAGEVRPVEEGCEGSDEDCDGETDEALVRPCYDGPEGTAGVGRCVAGERSCAAGAFGDCAAQVVPVVEACNDVDDDCDGETDEALSHACYSGPEGTAGVGRCQAGEQRCAAGLFQPCEGELTPANDVCNAIDDDCDGETDEGTRRDCYTGPEGTEGVGLCAGGFQACVDGAFAEACEAEVGPAEETCDARDEDCDGETDEGFGLGEVCKVGEGACEREGRIICADGGAGCDAEPGEPAEEVCNGVDDDCDGDVDEGLGCLQVSAGSYHTCALLAGGRVKCWGRGGNGRLGVGNTASRGDQAGEMGAALETVALGAGRRSTQVTAGGHHTCAVLDDQSVKCWGDNFDGQLGLGHRRDIGDGPGEMGDALPAVSLGAGRRALEVCAGEYHTCARLGGGEVKCWGYNDYGQLGLGHQSRIGDQPGEMGDALPTVSLGAGRSATTLSCGRWHTCAILDDGTVKCWGSNSYGQLGLGDGVGRGAAAGQMGDALPVVALGAGRTARSIDAGYDHTCAVLDDGSVKCWGRNSWGALGLGDTRHRGDGPGEMGDALPAVDLGPGRTATAVTAGWGFACALLDDGTTKCWGSNENGRLGQGHLSHLGDAPGEVAAAPAIALGAGRFARSIAAGSGHACAVLDDSTLRCWGNGLFGRHGLGHADDWGTAPEHMGDNLPVVRLE